MSEGLPAEMACRVVEVSVSGLYAWQRQPLSARAVRHAMLAEIIGEIHDASRQTYGARRVHAELVLGRGSTVARCTVELLMSRPCLSGLPGRPRYRKIWNQPTASDLVEQRFERDGPNELWVTDIERHEALSNLVVLKGHLVVLKGHRRLLVAASG